MKRLLAQTTLLLFFALFFPNSVFATEIEKWGPHLKDYGNNDMISSARGAYDSLGGGSDTWVPFTVMVAGAESGSEVAETASQIQTVLNAAAANKMFPTFRITTKYCEGGWEQLSGSYALNTTQAFNQVTIPADIPSDLGSILVEWGNEVNLGLEWGNEFPEPATYENTLDSFNPSGRFKKVKSAMNTSNPTIPGEAMDASDFYGALSSNALSGSGGITSHPYDVFAGQDRYTVNAWRFDLEKSLQHGSPEAPIVLTEFGLAPSNGNFSERIDFVKTQYQAGLYNDVSAIRAVTPLLLDDSPGGSGAAKIIVFGPGGTTNVIDPFGGTTSRGGGDCEPPLTNVNDICAVNDDDIPSGDNIIRGDAITSYITSTGVRVDRKVVGLGIAWITPPIIPRLSDTPVSTYKYVEVGEDGKFVLDDLGEENLHIGIFCNDRVLETYGIEWDKAGSEVELKLRYSENLNCNDNKYCVRPDPDNREIDCNLPADPDQLEIRRPWGEPGSVADGVNILEICLTNPLQCLLGALEGLIASLTGDNTYETDELNLDRSARIQGVEFALGCSVEPSESCEEIKKVNQNSSGVNLGRCGRSWILGKDARTIRETCRTVYEGPLTADKKVCTQPDGTEIKLHQIQLPYTSSMDGDDVLSSEYFPYYLCFQEPTNDGIDEIKTYPDAPSVTDEDYRCGGVHLGVDTDGDGKPDTSTGDTCDMPTVPASEGERLTDVVSKGDVSSLESADKAGKELAKMFSRPGKDVLSANILSNPKLASEAGETGNKLAQATTDSDVLSSHVSVIQTGVTRARWYGTECTCAEPFRDQLGDTDPSTFVCLQGGIKFSLVDSILNSILAICDLDGDGSVDNPPPEGCGSAGAETGIKIKTEIPYVKNFTTYGVVSDMIKKPGTATRYVGCGGTTAGQTGDEDKERIPYTSDACSTSIQAKNDIMDTFKRPQSDLVGY